RPLPSLDDTQLAKGSPGFVECGKGKRGCRTSRLGRPRQDLEAKGDGRRAVPLLDAGSRAFGHGVCLATAGILVFLAGTLDQRYLSRVEQFRGFIHEVESTLEQPALQPWRTSGAQPLYVVANHKTRAVFGDPRVKARPSLE